MRRLLTTATRGQIQVTWHIADDHLLQLLFSRVAIGLAWGASNYAAVIGERLIEGREQVANRYWVVLDELQTVTPQELFAGLIPLKDDYRARTVIAGNNPAALADVLRQTEGLTHYRTENYATAEQRWPSFVEFDVTAALYQTPAPDEQLVHQELDRWLTEQVAHPDTEQPVTDSAGEPVYRLMLPHDFTNAVARTGVQQARLEPCLALWYACSYLEKRRAGRAPQSQDWEHRPGMGGY